jgi:hypothetical protein
MNVGGNQAVTYGGVANGGGSPFDDPDGGQSCVTVNQFRVADR